MTDSASPSQATPCICEHAGYCEAHQRQMSEAFWKVCREQPGGFEAFQKPRKQPMRGLGDVVAKVTSAVGIKPCGGCEKRQKKLNEMFPFGKEG